ncbi:hypothetical protein [Sphingomonas sanxanigenens]|uniref:Solute-binding protein family 3/N-terminal domain-containing protein n=1 Tax=Sphingomonas sanxanigenens DSM 19645 = NX02 TaxID=1123269 RepID=W0A8P4_9SPHN|nr:hypothetical protein [Sphingomonas sanxanigenens]AHE52862.1 hypothetical protein NX02_05625 [Sphingomonas sanxanigenens DSM 19645 = NX02]
MTRGAALALLMFLAGCDTLPRDPGGTLERVETTHRLRVGVAAGLPVSRTDRPARLIEALERRTGARAEIRRGAAEPLFVALRAGRLDLVIAPVAADSPWATDITFGPPLATTGEGDDRLDLVAAMRNGENRWIMLIERASRAVAPAAASR